MMLPIPRQTLITKLECHRNVSYAFKEQHQLISGRLTILIPSPHL